MEVKVLESYLRRDLKREFGSRLLFLEPGLGSTEGVPDCYLMIRRRGFWLELKDVKGGFTRAQRVTFPRMMSFGVPVFVVRPLASRQGYSVQLYGKHRMPLSFRQIAWLPEMIDEVLEQEDP